MLKSTNSFYRYLTVTCERVDYKAHVKKYLHLCHEKNICIDINLKRQFSCHPVVLKNNINKRLKIKAPSLNSDVLERTEEMSKSLQPTAEHVSYGGTFYISSDDESPSENCNKSTRKCHGEDHKGQIPPNFRCWEPIPGRKETDNGNTVKFKVVSYNVLAQYLLESHPYLYKECSARDLKWKVRSARLYEEILVLAPDILCLQEVQQSHISTFYSKFEDIGYTGVFKQKTGEKQDGCAIYFKKTLFDLKDYVSVEYYQPSLSLLNRHNIGIMAKLIPRWAPHCPIVVATTHLLYNPKRSDVRLAQMQVFLAEIDRFAFEKSERGWGHLPIILTGDFNSGPESAVINLLDNGHVSAGTLRDNVEWERIGVTDNCQHLSVYLNRRAGSETDFKNLKIYHSEYCDSRPDADADEIPGPFAKLFNGSDLWQTLQLVSVYDKYKIDGKYEATTFQDYWVTVDYMYFSSCSELEVTDRLRLPTAEECSVLRRLPNAVFGSDHLAVAACFKLKLPSSKAPQ